MVGTKTHSSFTVLEQLGTDDSGKLEAASRQTAAVNSLTVVLSGAIKMAPDNGRFLQTARAIVPLSAVATLSKGALSNTPLVATEGPSRH